MKLNLAIVGCGVIGRRRAAVARELKDHIVIVADIDAERAKKTAEENDCEWTCDWRKAVEHEKVDAVIVSTINKFLAPVTIEAASRAKHVLSEKPLGRNHEEARLMVDAAHKSGVILKTGFNHRHHPAIQKAHALCTQNEIGPLMFIRATYGHGGRPGYDREWRADADLSGGGELLDQGVHIIDLCRWFLGDFVEVSGFLDTCYWDLGYRKDSGNVNSQKASQLEDNAFALLRTAEGRVAQFQTSWTQWKNRFTFEAFGRDGYAVIDGLGGSYGKETLIIGKRRPESGPPIEERFEFTGPDLSWQEEWAEFRSAIQESRQPLANGDDGLRVMQVIAGIYESARTGKAMRLDKGEV
jgi:predicted dehydrogenase